MAHVRMRTYISGGRGDGSQWPDAGGILECGDGEAQDLIRAGLAWPHEQPDAAAEITRMTEGWDDNPEVPPGGAVSHAEPPAGTGTGDETSAGPAVRAAKQEWVMHAVGLGADPVVASAMTKADLIARYGS